MSARGRIVIYPLVDAADVVAGATEAELREVEERLQPGLNRRGTRPERIIDALYNVHIPEIDSVDWATPLTSRRASRRAGWRPREGFACGTTQGSVSVRGFGHRDTTVPLGGSSAEPSSRCTRSREPPLSTSTSWFRRPDHAIDVPYRRATRETPPRWPYPTAEADVGAVQALAAHLAPRVIATFNGAARLSRDPVLVPICAMAASVIAVANRVSARRTTAKRGRRKAWNSKVTWSLFDACLDALDLGEHRGTAERILVRDHPEHIHIAAPPGLQPTPGLSALGAFASDPKTGGPMRVEDAQRRLLLPRVLYCLAAPEPF